MIGRCAGCGSKVGASVLSRAMKRVKKYNASRRPEVLAGIGDDAAIVKPPSEDGVMVQTIDYFKSFVSDPFLFGQIAANHALSDCFAMNADPITALALCTLPYGPEKVVEDELVHMLAGMCSVLHREGCMLVGGHTAEGSEPALGLSVYGFLSSRYQPFPKGLSVDCLGKILLSDSQLQQ